MPVSLWCVLNTGCVEEVAGAAQLRRDQRLDALLEGGEGGQRLAGLGEDASTAARCRRAWWSRPARCRCTRPSSTRRLAPRVARALGEDRLRLLAGVQRQRVEGGCGARLVSPAAPGPRPGWRCSWPRAARCASGPAARGRRRTCWRSPPAAPAPCRCWTWPSRGGCAARASAAPGGRRDCRALSTLTPTRRPGSERLNSSRQAR